MRATTIVGALAMVGFLLGAGLAPGAARRSPDPLIERGRKLVAFGSCNDCHTAGWRETDGRIPVSQWLEGQAMGFRGPWGTIYPINVRLWFAAISEDDWLTAVATRAGHPPMKWTDLRTLDVEDRRAIYRFVRSLGPAGVPAPLDVPPGREPTTPYINIMPEPGATR